MKRAIVLLLLLSGCAPGIVAGGGVAGAVLQAVTAAPTVLSDVAQLGCSIQAIANAQGNPLISQVAGQACKW